jgi:uncharacterized membrane protein
MGAPLDVAVSRVMQAPPDRVRRIMFDAQQDPGWMAAVKVVERLSDDNRPGARVRRVGRFMGRELRWTTETVSSTTQQLDLRIIDGPMRGTVTFLIEPAPGGSNVSIRNIGEAPASRRAPCSRGSCADRSQPIFVVFSN